MKELVALFVSRAALFALVAARVCGFVVVSPFPGQNVAMTPRVCLVVVLSVVVAAFAPGEHVPTSVDLALGGQAAVEVGCGLVIGGAFAAVFSAAEVFATLVGQATGLAMPSVLNPMVENNDSVLGRIITSVAMLLALSAGVHRIAIGALLESFRALPVGGPAALDGSLMPLADLGIDAFATGVRLAMPVMGATLVVQMALAIISRSAPSLQLFSVGFTLLFGVGVLTLVADLDDVATGLVTHFSSLSPAIDRALASVRR